MTRKYTRWTKELLEPIVKSSISYAECMRKMGLKDIGGNHGNLVKNIDKFGLDTSHMLHQAHNRGKELINFEGLKGSVQIKKRLIKEKGHVCECCGLSEWLGQPIPLELEHTNGNNRDNSRENLKLLCCNCHAQTPTWRNRKR
jgi:hypothetical protein